MSEKDKSDQLFVMGTAFSVRVISDDPDSDLEAAEEEIRRQDELISWRKESSLTSLFNEDHSADMSEISGLLVKSLEVCEKSGGAFDMSILPLSRLWDFDKMSNLSFDIESMDVPPEKEIKATLEKVDYRELKFDKEKGILSSKKKDISLELGAVGKGWAIDRALELLSERGATGALISAGSSIGAIGTKKDGSDFAIAMRDPRGSESDYIGIIHSTDCTVSTSGDYERYFEKDGKRYHHILDPHTGYPADSGLIQTTIICDDGSLGDALSTASFVLGLDEGMLLAKEYNVLAIFVDKEKNIWYNSSDVLHILEFLGETSGYKMIEYTY